MLKRILLICLLLVTIKATAQTNLYVDSSVSSSGSGSSWASAYKTLNEALNVANTASTTTKYIVNVAKGTYYPGGVASDTTRDSSYCIFRGGIKVFGGFPSGGGATRNATLNRTILSGNIRTASVTDNSYHIMVISNVGSSSDSVIISGFEFTGGYANGSGTQLYNSFPAYRVHGAALLVVNVYAGCLISECSFYNNTASSNGGGVFISDGKTTFLNCIFNNDSAGVSSSIGAGGGLCVSNTVDMVKILNCDFSNCFGGIDGGGLFLISNRINTIEGCNFTSNTAGQKGGGIYLDASVSGTTVTNCTFTQNRATNTSALYAEGGGMHIVKTLSCTITGCSFIRNFALSNGGGVGGKIPVILSTFDGNTANQDGGGAYLCNVDSSLLINNKAGRSGGGVAYGTASNSKFFADTAANGGGAILIQSGTIHDCILGKNVASYGGGIYNTISSATLLNLTISGNIALINGGGVYARSTSSLVSHCLISGNKAAAKGGAIYDSASNPTIYHCTLAADTAVTGNGIYNTTSSPVILNSIIWGGAGSIFNFFNSTPSITYSIVEGGYSGTGNTSGNPLFINPLPASAIPDTGGNFNIVACSPAVNSGLNSGSYTYAKDIAGNPRLFGTTVDRGAYEYQGTVSGPSQPSVITGATATCNGVSQTFSVVVDPTVSSYTWSLPSGWTGTSTTNSITVIPNGTGGTISVTGSNGCGTSIARTLAVTGLSAPAQPGTISGNASVCSGVAQTYSVTAVSGATYYVWTLPSGWSGTSTTNSISVIPNSSGGSVSVAAGNSCGTSIAATQTITSLSIPGQPSTVSGNAAACNGTASTYSVTSDPSATAYNWSLPSGWTGSSSTNSITATPGAAGGTISVTAGNTCGNSTARTLTVTSSAIPSQPSSITGVIAVCSGVLQSFSVTNDPTVTTYNWSLPSGWSGTSTTNSISVTPNGSGGTISVTATNFCGTGIGRTLTITSYTAPAQPAAITGSTSVCSGISQTYSVTSDPNITNYVWTLPSGWSGTSTTNSISTTPGIAGGTVSVTAGNTCGNSAARTTTVNASSIPVQPSTISGSVSVCTGVSQTFSVTADPSVTTYNWTLPSGWIGSSSTNSITVTPTGTGGTISITGTNFCGTSAARSLAVISTTIPAQPGAVTGSTAICSGAAQTYSVASDPNVTSYNWTLPSGWTGTSTTNSISVTPGGTGGTISVTGTNSCGTSLAQTLSISIIPLPAQPGTVSGSTAVCSGVTQTYSVASDPNVTSYNWTLPTGWSGSSTSNAMIATTGTASGTISVSGTNTCGAGLVRTLAVTTTTSVVPTVSITATGGSTICAGTTVIFNSAITNGGSSPVYAWRLNGTTAGTGTSYTASSLANSDSVTLTLTSSALCASPVIVTSTAVYMTVNPVPSAPTVTTPVVYCQNATAASLTATGSNLKWYNVATGGTATITAPTPITTSAGSTSYWVSQTSVSGCESPRAQITVNVLPTPAKPSASGTTPVCVGDTIFLSATSSATSPTYSWTGPGFTSSLQNPFKTNATAASAGIYRVTVTENGCVSAPDSVNIVISCLDSVWAGDVNYDKLVDNLDALEIALTMGSTGPARSTTSILWQPEHGRDWATFLPSNSGVNRKHADCDSDGTVAYSDTLAVFTNYGLTHPKGIRANAKQTAGNPDLYFDLSGITPRAGMTITVPIKLGTTTTAMENIAGLAARVMIDGVTPADIPTLSYSSGWLGTTNNTLRFTKAVSNNRLDWAYARTDQRNNSGSGILAWVTFTLPAGVQSQTMKLYFDNVVIVDSNGSRITKFNILDDSVTVLANNTSISINTRQYPRLTVLPNPSPGACIAQLTLPVAGHFSLELRDISGRLIWQTSGDGKAGLNTISLPVDLVSSGMYLISLRSDGQVIAPVRWIKE